MAALRAMKNYAQDTGRFRKIPGIVFQSSEAGEKMLLCQRILPEMAGTRRSIPWPARRQAQVDDGREKARPQIRVLPRHLAA
jgi:hypothetical protein